MYVGRDTNGNGNPDASEQLCSSTSDSYHEYCSLPESGQALAAGNYWVLVQKLGRLRCPCRHFYPGTCRANADGGSGPIQVAAPASVMAGVPYTFDLSWNLPGLEAGDVQRE